MQRKTVFVIDDEHDIRETLKESIEDIGFDVATASNGQEGLEQVSKIPNLGLILLDLMMPIMNGWQFMKALQADPEHAKIPVVIVTALGDQVTDGLNAKIMIRKPIDLTGLLETVEYYCSDEFKDAEVVLDISVLPFNALS
jgi:CheY-like chemotaxis protein